MNKYDNSVVYMIKCKDESVKDSYVGSTTNFNRRKRQHKYSCNNENYPKYNRKVYTCIRENGGFENWTFEIIVQQKCNDKKELHKIERWFMELYETNLNSKIPSRPHKEYYKQWREDNKERIKKYNEENKEKTKEYHKQYREANKEKISEKNKQYRESNKEKISEKGKIKMTCECGSTFRKSEISRHRKTIKHINYINNI